MKRLPVLILASIVSCGASANLFRNGGFEEVPGVILGQGLLPNDWIAVNLSPDTYSNDGSFGLSPGEFGNFPGVSAHGGLRWVAGSNVNQTAGGESFAQVLSSTLLPDTLYRVEGWLHQALRFDLNNPGGYDLWLDKGNFADRLYVAHIGDTTSPTAGWNLYSAEFMAPTNAAEYTRFVFAPIATGNFETYPGLDDVSLAVVPEPTSLVLLAGGLIALAGRRHRR